MPFLGKDMPKLNSVYLRVLGPLQSRTLVLAQSLFIYNYIEHHYNLKHAFSDELEGLLLLDKVNTLWVFLPNKQL